jgi:CHAD domain-containing protein
MPLNRDRIDKSIRTLSKYVKKSPRQPLPEQVHDLRTHARKLATALHSLSLDSNGSQQRLLKGIKKLRKRAGRVRDMDVLTAKVCSVRAKDEQDCAVQLLEHLGNERRRQAKKLHSTVLKESAPLKKGLRQTSYDLDKLFQEGQPSEAGSEASGRAVQLASDLAIPPRLNKQNLHPYRLKVKELRYVLQMGEKNGQGSFVRDLGAVKDAIGEWHDWEELTGIANEVLDHGSGCPLLQKLKEVSETTFKEALALANKLRRHVKVSQRKESRNSRTNSGLSRPVLVATSAMIAGNGKAA